MNIVRGLTIVGRSINRNLPNIFTALGIVGVGVSVYTTAIAAPKVADICKNMPTDEEHAEEAKQKICEAGKAVVPVAAAVAGTIACMVISNRISHARIESLGNAYNALNKEYAQYRAGVIGVLGGEAHQRIQAYVDEQNKPKEILKDPFEREYTFYDPVTRMDFQATCDEVNEGIQRYYDLCNTQRYVSVNEYADCFGLGHFKDGYSLGWYMPEIEEWYGDTTNHVWTVTKQEEDGSIWFVIRMAYKPTVDGCIDEDDPALAAYAKLCK